MVKKYYYAQVKWRDQHHPSSKYNISDYSTNRSFDSLSSFLEFQGITDTDPFLEYKILNSKAFDTEEELRQFISTKKEISPHNVYIAMKLCLENKDASYNDIKNILESNGILWNLDEVRQYITNHNSPDVNLGTGLNTGDIATGATFVANCLSDGDGWSFCREYLFTDFTIPCVGTWINSYETKYMEKEEQVKKEPQIDIRQKAYDYYKLDWMKTHGSSIEDLIEGIDNLYQQYKEDGEEITSLTDLAEEWEFDSGFSGSIWVCFDEFLDAEYQDEEYMETLLNDKEYELYKEDVEQLRGEER